MNIESLFITEIRRSIRWHSIWLLILILYAVWIYDLWLTFLIPILVLLLFLYVLTSGVRLSIGSVSDKTGELFFSLPISRKTYLCIQMLANYTPILLFFSLQYIIMTLHSFGPTGLIDQDKILVITYWGMMFGLFVLFLGSLIGIISGTTSRGYQVSIILVFLSYIINTVINMNPGLQNFSDLNPLSYYQPLKYLLFKSYSKNISFFNNSIPFYPIMLLAFIIIFLILNIQLFNRKDLTENATVQITLLKKLKFQNMRNTKSKLLTYLILPFTFFKKIFFPKNVRNNPFVFWARIFENDLPLTADFIYSDNVIIFMAFFALFLLFPFQISYYPGDRSVLTSINTFGQSKIFTILEYGHNLNTAPYLWFLSVNAIGLLWVIFFPLALLWVFKAFIRDGSFGYGEIFGGLALSKNSIVIQRLIAIIVELVFLDIVAIFWLIVTEILNGQTFDKEWEILSILSLLPLYIFIITVSGLFSLYYKNKGFLATCLFFTIVILSFALNFLTNYGAVLSLGKLFGLYDPILIIANKSLLVNNDGLIVLIIMDVFTTIGLLICSGKYSWLNISEKANVSTSS